jgi:hypothetical protein
MLGDETNQPRCQHYFMAHYALRQVALDNPLQYLAVLASENVGAFLETLLDTVNEHCQSQGQTPFFGAEAMEVHLGNIKNYPCAIVQMPPPVGSTEAYFTALVLLVDISAETPADPETMHARYFTLEHSIGFDGSSGTVLAEWSANSHLHHGVGSEATIDAFTMLLSTKL